MPPNVTQVALTDMERGVIISALHHYETELKREAKLRRNDPNYHVSASVVTLVEMNSVKAKLA